MKKTAKIILSSAMSMAVCASIIAGSTFALFTSESDVNIAITSGKIDVVANITALATNSNAIDAGPIEDIVDWVNAASGSSDGSFTGEFGLGGTADYSVTDGVGTLVLNQIAPGDAVKFTFSVSNKSTVSVKYQIRMRTIQDEYAGEGDDPYPDTKLSSALEVKLGDNAVKSGLVYETSAWANADAAAPETVVFIRLPKDVGDQYQQRSCSVSLSVLAVQGNAKETTYCEETSSHTYGEDNHCIYCGEENLFAEHNDEESDTYTITGVDSNATELEIPAMINGKKVELAANAFYGNTSLTSVKIDEGTTSWPAPESAVHGTYQGLFGGCSNLEHVELPQSLTEIASYSFVGCSNLKEIELPQSVKKIGNYAFQKCSALTELEIPDGVTEIGYGAFYYDKALTSFEIPDSVTTLGNSVFYGCDNLTSVKLGNGITKIDYNMFSECTALKTVELGNGVTEIGHTAFSKTALETFTMPDTVTKLDYSAFYQCPSLTNVVLSENLETIGNNAFDGCTSLKSVTFNGTKLTSLGQYAFQNCKALTDVNIQGPVTDVGARVFQGCSNLVNVTFGEGLTKISSSMFEGCSSLTEIHLPDSLTSIGNGAFYNCTQLTTLYIGENASSLETIDSSAFLSCSRIKDIYFAGTTDKWKEIITNNPIPWNATNATVRCSNGTLDRNGNPITG